MNLDTAVTMSNVIQQLLANPRASSARFGLALGVNSDRLKPIAEAFEKSKMELVTKYSEKDDDGASIIEHGQYKLVSETAKEFEAAFAELVSTDVDVVLQKLDINRFPNEIEAAIVQALLPMISLEARILGPLAIWRHSNERSISLPSCRIFRMPCSTHNSREFDVFIVLRCC